MTDKKQKLGKAVGVLCILAASVVGVTAVASQGDTVTAMEKAYSTQLEVLKSAKTALCETEQALAVAKLEVDDAALTLSVEEITRLQAKVKGEGLSCLGL